MWGGFLRAGLYALEGEVMLVRMDRQLAFFFMSLNYIRNSTLQHFLCKFKKRP